MKRTVFGVFLMAIGMAMLVTGTTLFTVSAQSGGVQAVYETADQENRVHPGEYFKDGDPAQDSVTISDDKIIFVDGTAAGYVLNVWKNIPETDEESGRITYRDYCFLKLEEERLSYDPSAKEVIIDGVAYRMP